MFRLTVVTYLALGSALAKPPPAPKQDVKPVPYGGDPQPVPFQGYEEKPEPIPFKGEERITYTLPSGRYYFQSPNYPSNYPNDYDSSFSIKGDNNQAVTVTCDPFRMESHSSCGYDYLSINGQKYCGTNKPPTTTVTQLNIRIKTDNSVRASGFYCLVTIAAGSGATTTTSAPPAGDCRCGQSQTRVVGGTDATAGQFPWQAGLVESGGTSTFCGGSVINNWYILTAAHCTEGSTAGNIEVLLGDLRLTEHDAGQQRFSVQKIIKHPQYTSVSGSGWDFSLLKLDREITFTNTIFPVCLAEAGQMYAGAAAIASGYGQVGATAPQAPTLQHVELPVWEQSSCSTKWAEMSVAIKNSMICAGGYDEGGKSVCYGDSGGPLVTKVSDSYRLIGVVSYGLPCAVAGWPDVYARVTEALSWIASNTADAATCSP